MLKVKVTVPAVCTGIGPGLDALGLALGLHNTLEFSVRPDTQFVIDTQGEGDFPASVRHPAMRAATALFQRFERAPVGLRLTIAARIPTGCGLGELAALTVAGLIGANNLIDAPLKRDALAEMACELVGCPSQVISTLLGGLTVCSGTGRELMYRRLEVAAQQVVLVVPDVGDYQNALGKQKAKLATLDDASFNLGRSALLIEGFRKNDPALLGRAMHDRIVEPGRSALIPGYQAAREAGFKAGAFGVALSGSGPALVAFSQVNHRLIADDMQKAFAEAGVKTRQWIVNVDTQGVAFSVSG